MRTRKRTKPVSVRMSVEEISMLQALAFEDGVPMTQVVRGLIRKAHARVKPRAVRPIPRVKS